MLFYSVRDLNSSSKEVWQSLSDNGELVITNNGRPTAIMINVDGADLEETLAAIRQANTMKAVNRMRLAAQRSGASRLSDEDIQAEIDAVREERKG